MKSCMHNMYVNYNYVVVQFVIRKKILSTRNHMCKEKLWQLLLVLTIMINNKNVLFFNNIYYHLSW